MSDAARIPVEVRQKFSQMREDIKKLSLTLQDVESQQAEYSYVILFATFHWFVAIDELVSSHNS